jgi:hypothetical protein
MDRWLRPVAVLTLFAIAEALGSSAYAAGQDSLGARRLDPVVGPSCTANAASSATRDTRTEGAAALYLLRTNGDTGLAEQLLQREFAAQNMDRSSPKFGAVVNPATPTDPNDTVFAAQAWGPILLQYRDRLSPSTLAMLRDHAAAALVYLQYHPVSVDYTNIHLLTASEEVIFAGIFGDATAARRGMAGLTQWLTAVRANGIHEFESPTYATVNMDALYEGASYAADPGQRALFARALDYVWRELAANLFLPKMRIAGAQSRSYDPLHGADEPMNVKLNFAGYDAPIRDASQLRCLDMYSFLQDDSSYAMPADARTLSSYVPRVVEQRWAADPNATKYTYITADYAIGSSNEDYDGSDRVASIDFAGGAPTLPSMRLIGDVTGYWFGPTPKVQRDGGRVWNHAPTRPSIVQRENIMLILTDMDAGVPDEGAPLSVGVIVPALANGVAIGDVAVDASQPFEKTISANDVVTVRVGSSTAATRIAYAEHAPGTPAAIRLGANAASIAKGVARVYATLSTSTPVASRDLRGIVLMGVDSGAGAATIGERLRHATIDQSTNGSLWTVTARVDGHELSSTYDMTTHKSVRRSIDGAPVVVPNPLAVNGQTITP